MSPPNECRRCERADPMRLLGRRSPSTKRSGSPTSAAVLALVSRECRWAFAGLCAKCPIDNLCDRVESLIVLLSGLSLSLELSKA